MNSRGPATRGTRRGVIRIVLLVQATSIAGRLIYLMDGTALTLPEPNLIGYG